MLTGSPRQALDDAQSRRYAAVRQFFVTREESTLTATVEELAPRTEDEVRAHLAAGKLVEGLQHMSPEYLQGIRRILTVSADPELVPAPASLRAAALAPAVSKVGSAVSIIQDELAHP